MAYRYTIVYILVLQNDAFKYVELEVGVAGAGGAVSRSRDMDLMYTSNGSWDLSKRLLFKGVR